MATRNIVPRDNNEGSIGTALKKWATGFIKVLTVDSVNKVTITEPATSATLTIEDGHSLTVTANTTLSGTPFAAGDAIPSPGPCGETTPNTIRGLNKEIFKTASADSPLTAAECSGTIVSNYGMTDADCVISLPTAAAGLSFVLILPAVRAKYFKLRAAATDLIILDGEPGSDNGYVGVASGYAARDAISLMSFKDTDGGYAWMAMTVKGTWVAS